MKRWCNCGKGWTPSPDDYSSKCPDCSRLNEARCKPRIEHRNMPGYIQFHLTPSYTTTDMLNEQGYTLNGFCVRKKIDNSTSVHINLFNLDKFNLISEILRIIQHEFFCHKILFDIGEIDAGLKGDCELMKKTERWLNDR